MQLKGSSLQKCTLLTTPCNDIIFHISVSIKFLLLPFLFWETLWSHSSCRYGSLKTGWTLYFKFPFINGSKKVLHFLHLKLVLNVLVPYLRQKKISMFGVTQPSLLKSTESKLFFARNHKKLWKTYIYLLKSQRYASLCHLTWLRWFNFLTTWV